MTLLHCHIIYNLRPSILAFNLFSLFVCLSMDIGVRGVFGADLEMAEIAIIRANFRFRSHS